MSSQLYKEEILEHYKNPSNFGKPGVFDVASKQVNPFCGDEIEMFVLFAKDLVVDIGFIGAGCAISIASTSFLTEYTLGKSKKELTKFSESDMLALLGIEVSESRKKCVLLGYFVLRDCLAG